MFQIHSIEEILSPFKTPSALSSYARGKLSRVPGDVIGILDAMQRLAGHKLAEEMIFVNDEGKGLYHDYPDLAPLAVGIAVNGQGESWLMDVKSGKIAIFDHGSGDTYPLEMDFWQFLRLADLIGQYERAENTDGIYEAMAQIDIELLENYPFEL